MTIRVFVLADVRAYRDGLSRMLEQARDIRVLGATARDRPGLEAIADARPDVVLIDLATLDTLPMVHAIAGESPHTRVVALAVPEAEGHVVACAEAGILGCMQREASVGEVIASVRTAASGEALYPPRTAAALVHRLEAGASRRASPSAHPLLTRREFEILGLIDEGKSNKEIARDLCIEVATVKNHVHSILGKLEVHRRGEAAAYLRRMDRHGGDGAGDLDPRTQCTAIRSKRVYRR